MYSTTVLNDYGNLKKANKLVYKEKLVILKSKGKKVKKQGWSPIPADILIGQCSSYYYLKEALHVPMFISTINFSGFLKGLAWAVAENQSKKSQAGVKYELVTKMSILCCRTSFTNCIKNF